MPVWGFADVTPSSVEQLEPGTRVFGYLPPSSELLVDAGARRRHGFIDAAAHRAELPPAYNSYRDGARRPRLRRRARGRADAAASAVLHLLADRRLPRDSDLFGAGTVVLSSASSKTASALAFLLSRREGIDVVGLTSTRSAEFARALGVYDHVLAYDELDSLPAGRAVYVDMAGDAAVREAVHAPLRRASSRTRPSSAPPTTTAWATCPTSCRGRGRRSSSRPTASPSAAPTGAARASSSAWPRPGIPTSRGRTAGCEVDPRRGPEALEGRLPRAARRTHRSRHARTC